MSLFASNDELFAKMKSGNPGFDVIMPSNEYVTRMRLAEPVGADRPREDCPTIKQPPRRSS